MQLQDLSHLKSGEEIIDIPLNGEVYQALGEPPAEIVLGAMGQAGGQGEIAAEIARLQGTDGASIQELAEKNPVLMMRVAQAGMTQTERSIAFMMKVLLPDSARRFRDAMQVAAPNVACDPADPRRLADDDERRRPTDPADVRPPSDEEQVAHRRRGITLRQCMGVYQLLMGEYSGRPTVPPSSSESGHGGTGGTSTGGVPAVASTP